MRYVPMLVVAAMLCATPITAPAQAEKAKSGHASHDMHQLMVLGARESQAMKPSGDVDRDFLAMMRHHHQTGIRMAEHEAQHGKDPKVKDLAAQIAASQKKEMKELDGLLGARRQD